MNSKRVPNRLSRSSTLRQRFKASFSSPSVGSSSLKCLGMDSTSNGSYRCFQTKINRWCWSRHCICKKWQDIYIITEKGHSKWYPHYPYFRYVIARSQRFNWYYLQSQVLYPLYIPVVEVWAVVQVPQRGSARETGCDQGYNLEPRKRVRDRGRLV